MHGGAVSIPSRATCVVWHAKRASAPSELVAALQRPGFDRADCDSVFAVVARIGLLRRAAPVAPIVLLLVDPHALRAEIGALLAVLDRIAPGIVLWAFTPGTNPAIRQVTREELMRSVGEPSLEAAAAAPVVVAPRYRQPPALRLTDPHGDLHADPHNIPQAERYGDSLVGLGADRRAPAPAVAPAPAAAVTPAPSPAPSPALSPALASPLSPLRIADDGLHTLPKTDHGEEQGGPSLTQSGRPLLSDEELAMLLSDDPENAENSGA